MFLSLLRELWCYSVSSVTHFARLLLCIGPLEEVVLIVRQGGSNCPTKQILSDNLDRFSAKIQGSPNSPTRSF